MNNKREVVNAVAAVDTRHIATVVTGSIQIACGIHGLSLGICPPMFPNIGYHGIYQVYGLVGRSNAVEEREMERDDRVATVVGRNRIAIDTSGVNKLLHDAVVVDVVPVTVEDDGGARTDIHIERCVVDESLDNI